MADRTQLKAADHNDIADDDPFAELTRIMGFDPRQPVKPQAPAAPKAAPADQLAEEGDFDIDLEKELMGEFGADEDAAQRQEPAFESVAATMNDELAASLEQDFVFDDPADHFAPVVEVAAPQVEAAFGDDFDQAIANSLEDVSPLDDDLPMDAELAASLDQEFQLDGPMADATEHGVAEHAAAEHTAPAVEAAFDDDLDDAVSLSLEDELTLDGHAPFDDEVPAAEDHHATAAAVEHPAPVQIAEEADRQIPEAEFSDHFDEAMADVDMDMADVDMDFDVRAEEPVDIDEPLAVETPVEAVEAPVEAAYVAKADNDVPETDAPEVAAQDAFDDDFDLGIDEGQAEAAEEQVAEIAAAEPMAPAAVVAEPAKPIAAADERSLEDELNALLGAMTARPVPVAAKEPAPVQQPAVVAETAAAQQADPIEELDWDLDEHEPAEPQHHEAAEQHHEAAQAVDADLDIDLAGELDGEDFRAETVAAPVDVAFDDDAFDAAFARGINPGHEESDLGHDESDLGHDDSDLGHDESDLGHEPDRDHDQPDLGHDESDRGHDEADRGHDEAGRTAVGGSFAHSADWMRSTPPEPVRSWSRVTPVAAPPVQASFSAQPMASVPLVASALASAAPAYLQEPVEEVAAQVEPEPVRHEQPRYDEMPDVETVDVPERVVALADDLDIPELNFEEDQPVASAYDDLEAEFAGLLTEMNAAETAVTPARSTAYEDDTYSAGFKPGYDRDEAPAYAAKPAEVAAATATASHAAAASSFDMDNLPGSKPVSQADDFAVDELDYDPELDEAMSVPGLAEREATKPRSRGLMVAAIVGAVAIAGGLGAFALSLGGKGGSEAPVIVKADNAPIKVKPENPGGAVVPNQDNKVYDAVAKGTKPAEPVQEKLVTNTEEPVDVKAKEPESRVVDLSPDDTDAAPGTDAAGNVPAAAMPGVDASGNAEAAPAPKSEDRIAQVLQEADKGTNPEVAAVAPRKVRTMMVKPDGSLVPREEPAQAAPQVAAAEPTDPAPQLVAPAAQSDAEQTGTVAPATDQASDQPTDQPATEAAKPIEPAAAPTPKAEAKAQSANAQAANTSATVPVPPQRPSDQPVDVVGEVKPDQVASISPTAAATGGGSWSMQIASQPTVESAQSTYQDLQRRYGSVLSGRTANIVKAEIAGKGTFYRVRVPAQSRNDAINLCTSYKAAGGNCFVSR
ncbi:SPOR domain-containing protein [Mesorhizobium waimense]|uniref:SPOR domain-containing protein n=1 Tax=Mesorhizobium waimense TaxID=1300307 RepID=A0A3A5JYI0_9HYPH|nr:SPOR domain-containing protein [Mesorhizobium waimense]RJT28101.1 SPOR domain-containing protein [Mesorhizobium waimense]